MDDCVFCKIVKKEMASEVELENEDFVVFKDTNPKAPVHLLIVPKIHTQDIRTLDGNLWDGIREIAINLASKKNLTGFRLVHNAGDAAVVPHMHFHFLGQVAADREV